MSYSNYREEGYDEQRTHDLLANLRAAHRRYVVSRWLCIILLIVFSLLIVAIELYVYTRYGVAL